MNTNPESGREKPQTPSAKPTPPPSSSDIEGVKAIISGPANKKDLQRQGAAKSLGLPPDATWDQIKDAQEAARRSQKSRAAAAGLPLESSLQDILRVEKALKVDAAQDERDRRDREMLSSRAAKLGLPANSTEEVIRAEEMRLLLRKQAVDLGLSPHATPDEVHDALVKKNKREEVIRLGLDPKTATPEQIDIARKEDQLKWKLVYKEQERARLGLPWFATEEDVKAAKRIDDLRKKNSEKN